MTDGASDTPPRPNDAPREAVRLEPADDLVGVTVKLSSRPEQRLPGTGPCRCPEIPMQIVRRRVRADRRLRATLMAI